LEFGSRAACPNQFYSSPKGARKIGGDYQYRVNVNQADEMGLLAASFNHMSEGLAERDQVRDLLGKVVSLLCEEKQDGEHHRVTIHPINQPIKKWLGPRGNCPISSLPNFQESDN